LPTKVVIQLNQNIGAPAQAVVKRGDKVLVGQLIGQSSNGLSCNIHSSVSGTVSSTDPVFDKGGRPVPAVTITVEGDQWDPSIDVSDTIIRNINIDSQEFFKRISEKGIVGMGGAMFPTFNKLSFPKGSGVDTLIVNGVECEPYLTADHRVMLEHGEEILIGTKLMQKAIGLKKIFIGIEENKPDAIEHLTELAKSYSDIEIVPLKLKYPQGGEKQLIESITGKQVPSGKLPSDIGVIVQNISTVFAIYQAIQKNRPLIDRVVTITGKRLPHTGNFLVRLGTPIIDILNFAGFDANSQTAPYKVVSGGPMMGAAISNVESAVLKGTSGVLVLEDNDAIRHKELECIKCGKCIAACPMGLEPYLLFRLCELKRYDDLIANHIIDCIECGCCTFTCPAALPLLDQIRVGRALARKIASKK
jgi:electron transport complex protein RnfC